MKSREISRSKTGPFSLACTKISTWSVGSEWLMPSFFSGATPELSHFISLMQKELLVVGARLTYHVADVVIMGSSTCLLGFFLDLLVAMPVRLFLGSTCFLEGPFLPSWEATNVTVVPCTTLLKLELYSSSSITYISIRFIRFM